MNQETELAIRESLGSLGWLTADPSCPEQKHLAETYATATIAWLEASQGLRFTLLEPLRETYAVRQSEEFHSAKPRIEAARIEAARARLDLRFHIEGHGC